MKIKKRNKGKKALTAVGAVVAAGLTPGIIAASPGCLPGQGSSAEITAADVVAIDGNAYSFDELYAKQHPDSVDTSLNLPEVIVEAMPNTTKYGVIWISSSPPYDVLEGDTVYNIVTQEPRFPGGDGMLVKYIDSHIQYPANATKNQVQGRVIVKFVVKRTGEVGTVTVVRSVDKDLDEEAVRVVKSLPKFTPGRMNGQAVSVWYTLPVIFNLPQKNND